MNNNNVFDLEMGKSGKSSKSNTMARVSRDVNWDDEESIKDYFDSVI